MKTEIEAKFLHINHDEIRNVLHKLGAQCTQPMRLMKRKNFDFPGDRLEKEKSGWVRLRNEGDKITLCYKQLNDRTLEGTKEVCLIVDDFARTESFLREIGLRQVSYQETRRESWVLDGAQIELDEWPWVPPFIELEAESETQLKKVAAKLGFDFNDALHGSVENVYRDIFDVTDEDIDHISEIIFSDVPDWLESKRRP